MLLEQTLATLHALKLHGMATALDEQRGIPDLTTLAFEERLALLLERRQAPRRREHEAGGGHSGGRMLEMLDGSHVTQPRVRSTEGMSMSG